MEKRYQVFVSSTYTDLIEERNEVMQALLELECMPAGMELFPAATESQWAWIRKVIDESDYYVVIVAGRYGSVSKDTDLSYTEMEYRYAVDQDKPVIGFVHADPGSISARNVEQSKAKRRQLDAFRGLIQTRLCKTYTNPSDLGAKVSRSITQLKKQHPATGWVRADSGFGVSAAEVLRLREENDELQSQLVTMSLEAPRAAEGLASGSDEVELNYVFTRKCRNPQNTGWRKVGTEIGTVEFTWDEIFTSIAPAIIKNTPHRLSAEISARIEKKAKPALEARYRGERLIEFRIDSESWDMVLMQLRALKLIDLAGRDPELTRYGDNYATRLLAVPKGAKPRAGGQRRRRTSA